MDDPPHMCIGTGMTRLGQKEVNQPSMGLGWYTQIGSVSSIKEPMELKISTRSSMGDDKGWQSMSALPSI